MAVHAREVGVKRVLLLAVTAATLLGACTHARIVQREPSGRPPATARGPARPSVSPLPSSGVHVVSRGETLYGISFRYGLRYQDVAAWNGIADPYLIEIGQRLRLLPPGRGASASATVAPRPARPVAATTPPARPPSATPGASAPPVSRPVAPPASATTPPGAPAQSVAPAAAAPAAASSAAPAWRWPAQGTIVGSFVAGDRTRQGIDIAGSAGQDVLAAADGVVVYSGAGLVGYGELIIIKHSEEWLSAYAHNQKRLVAEGSRVSGGQVIARMGHTGTARDMLHFEIRRNGKPVDPQAQLPRR
jgi:lipoprotein NlpD